MNRLPTIKTIIVDDELAFINTLKILMKPHDQINIIGEARSVADAHLLLDTLQPDLVFLDVEMEDGTGFDLLNKIKHRQFKVIFVTAFDHYAIQAFKVSAIDYLLKPVVSDDLSRAIEKTLTAIEQDKIAYQFSTLLENINQPIKEKRKLVLKEIDTHHIIQLDDILWCQAEGSYTKFFLSKGEPILVSRHLKEFEDILDDSIFFRAHRSHLVNLNKIKKFEKSDGSMLYLEGGYTLPVSIRKKEKLAAVLSYL